MKIPDVPTMWRNDLEVSYADRVSIALLRIAGCRCELPLLGYCMTGGAQSAQIAGPRCRTCSIRVQMTAPEREDS